MFLTLIAHRYLISYVYGRTDTGQTGGLLYIWVIRRFATMLCLQPLLLGLIFLTKQLWVLGGVLVGCAVLIVIVVEAYCEWKTRVPKVNSLSPITRDSLDSFRRAQREGLPGAREDDMSLLSSHGARSPGDGEPRGSIASVLDMMSLTLAVMPSTSRGRGPIPLREYLGHSVSTKTHDPFT